MNKLFTTIVLGTLLTSTAVWAEVLAKPAEVKISAPKQKVEIALTSDGKPVPAGDITGYTFNVEDHTYEFMISMTKKDGMVIITPTDRAEAGEYDFTIKTKLGEVTVNVKMPLDEDPESIEAQAKALGITVPELMAQKGLAKPVGREKVTFKFPEAYHVGDKITIDVPCVADRTFECKFNGKIVRAGIGPDKFDYEFTAPGEYTFEYKEFLDSAPVAEGTGKTTVYERPAEVK